MPSGYRDWRLISVAHEEGNLNDLRAVLGNEIAIKAYREGKLPFPTARSLPGSPGVMSRQRKTTKPSAVPNLSLPGPRRTFSSWSKTSKKYAATGGWGFAQFDDGKPAHVVVRDCFACHVPAKARDYLFTHYAP